MRPLLLLVLAGCTTRVTVRDVRRGFDEDLRELRPAVATSDDFRPLRARNVDPMARTIERAERYLEERPNLNLDRYHVAALLACAYLTRGRVAEAKGLVRGLVDPGPAAPALERAVIERTRWLVGACYAMEGRLAVDAMVERGEGAVEFIEQYGRMVGYALPRRFERDYLLYLERYATDLRSVLFSPEPRSPRQLEARTRRIRELRRLLAELVYNDAAALVPVMASPDDGAGDATDEFFSLGLSSLFVTLSYLSDDLVPRVPMEGAQKQWLREQALSTYETVRGLARYYLPESRMPALETGLVPAADRTPRECRERLYARLYVAQKEVLAWITIRGE